MTNVSILSALSALAALVELKFIDNVFSEFNIFAELEPFNC